MTKPRIPLLDVNVLVALAWPNHQFHGAAREWFTQHSGEGWATTPPTESGFVRVSSNRTVLRSVASPATAIELLGQLKDLPGHAFWPDLVEMVVGQHVNPTRMTGHRQVTDAHLVAIALENRGRLVTFDSSIVELVDDRSAIEVLSGS